MTLTTDQILDLYTSGSYGTPDAPVRSSSPKHVFWSVYFGHRKASEYSRTIHYAAAKAGAIAKRATL